MKNIDWLEVISDNYEDIIDVSETAYKESVDNKHLTYTVELHKDGKVKYWYQTANGNMMTEDSFRGNSIVLMTFCQCHTDMDPATTDYLDRLSEKGIELALTEDEREDMDESDMYEWLRENHKEDIDAINQEWIDYYKNESYDEVSCKLERTREALKEFYDV